MEKINIGFLGYGTKALDCLMEHPLFDVRYFFAPKGRLCQDVYEAQERYKKILTMEVIEDNNQLAGRFAQISDVDCFLMNACPIILNQRVLSEMKVFNIHPGDIRNNRGHQPHCWTVLLGERRTKIVLHTVSEKIDSGAVIKSVDIKVSEDDSAEDVLNHAENQIPVLLDALYRHLTENAAYESVIENGNYRKIMTYEDYEINLNKDTKEQIKRKILCRSMHHGAFFQQGNERIYVDSILAYQEDREPQESEIAIHLEREEGKAYIYSSWRNIVFRLNKTEQIK